MLILFLILILILLLFKLLEQREVFLRVSAIGLKRERLFIRGNSLVELSSLRKGVAPVVCAISVVEIAEVCDCRFVVLVAIGRCTCPFRIFEQRGSRLIVTALQGLLPLLIGCQPQIIPDPSASRLWLHQKQYRQ